jgi:hypothetical protein
MADAQSNSGSISRGTLVAEILRSEDDVPKVLRSGLGMRPAQARAR